MSKRSLSINAQRSINCFPVVDKQDAKNVVAMYGTPGLKFFGQATYMEVVLMEL